MIGTYEDEAVSDDGTGERAGSGAIDPARLEAARRRGFFPLLLTLERMLGAALIERGLPTTAQEDPLRFRHDPSLAFATSEVTAVGEKTLPADPSDYSSRERQVVEVVTTFLGLTGAVSPLPQFLAEEVAQEDPDDPSMRDFLDTFHHRTLSFFLRAKTKYDPAATYRSDQSDDWSVRLLALLGFDVSGLTSAEGVAGEPRWRLLRLAPLLAEPSLTARALEVAIADVLGDALGKAEVKVEQFVENWVDIAAADRTRLGISATNLGQTAVLGSRLFDRAGKVRVVIGPLDREGFARFSRNGRLADEVQRLIRALSSGELEHEVVLELEPEAAAPATLGGFGARLGHNAWLGKQNRVARVPLDGARS